MKNLCKLVSFLISLIFVTTLISNSIFCEPVSSFFCCGTNMTPDSYILSASDRLLERELTNEEIQNGYIHFLDDGKSVELVNYKNAGLSSYYPENGSSMFNVLQWIGDEPIDIYIKGNNYITIDAIDRGYEGITSQNGVNIIGDSVEESMLSIDISTSSTDMSDPYTASAFGIYSYYSDTNVINCSLDIKTSANHWSSGIAAFYSDINITNSNVSLAGYANSVKDICAGASTYNEINITESTFISYGDSCSIFGLIDNPNLTFEGFYSIFVGDDKDNLRVLPSSRQDTDYTNNNHYVMIYSSKEEGVSGFVERLYTIALGRPSEPEGKANWVNALSCHLETGAAVARFFCVSDEIAYRYLTNEEYVETLYNLFFARESDAPGKSDWVSRLDAGATRESILEGFINSTEWANVCASFGIESGGLAQSNIEPTENVLAFTSRLFNTCLGRAGDSTGLDYWGREIVNRRQTATNVAYGFFFSEEFIGFDLSDEEFIERLYLTLMDRPSDEAGRNDWLNRLDNGATREEVFYGFANSNEFRLICESFGIYNL